MEFLVIGLAAAFNVIIIKTKLERGRIFDGLLDAAFLITVTMVFSGSYGALVVGTVASAIFSLYLLVSPPKVGQSKALEDFKQEFQSKLKERLKE